MEGLFRHFRRGFYGGGRPGGEEMCKYKIAREMCKYNIAREEMCKHNTAREERNSRLRKVMDGVGSGKTIYQLVCRSSVLCFIMRREEG